MALLHFRLKQLLAQSTWRRLAALSTLVMLAIWLIWLESLPSSSPQVTLPQAHGEPDYYLETAKLRRYNDQGHLFQTLEGERAVHYPDQNLIEIDNPLLQHWTPSQQHWKLQARKGELRNDQIIYFEDQVVITPLNSNSSNRKEFLTDRLWVNTVKETAHTPDQVTFQEERAITKSLGMFANLKQGKITLLNQIESHFQVQPIKTPQDTE